MIAAINPAHACDIDEHGRPAARVAPIMYNLKEEHLGVVGYRDGSQRTEPRLYGVLQRQAFHHSNRAMRLPPYDSARAHRALPIVCQRSRRAAVPEPLCLIMLVLVNWVQPTGQRMAR